MKKIIYLNIFAIIVILIYGIYLLNINSVYYLTNKMFFINETDMYNKEELYNDEDVLKKYNKYKESMLEDENYNNYLIKSTSCKNINDDCFKNMKIVLHDIYTSDEFVQEYLTLEHFYTDVKYILINITILIFLVVVTMTLEYKKLKIASMLPFVSVIFGLFCSCFNMGSIAIVFSIIISLLIILAFVFMFKKEKKVIKRKRKK